jgi:hypothetical protein
MLLQKNSPFSDLYLKGRTPAPERPCPAFAKAAENLKSAPSFLPCKTTKIFRKTSAVRETPLPAKEGEDIRKVP